MTVSVKPATGTQQGFAHILMVVLLLGGLVSGVYLVGQQTNLFPKAYSPKSPISAPVTPRPGCTTAYCPSPSPTPTPMPSAKRVFVTSTTYNGNLGGLSGADAKCQERANAASLGGTWKVWLSSDDISVATRLNHNTGAYKLVNGTTVANNWADLTDGTLKAPMNVSEINTVVDVGWVWTNSTSNGSIRQKSGASCLNWTSTSSGGATGDSRRVDSGWTDFGASGCYYIRPLYCFEQ